MLKKARIAVLVSGGGTNLQALLDSQSRGELPHGEICLVVSSQAGAYALERAAKAGVDGRVVSRKETGSQEAFEAGISALLEEYRIDLIILAGFMIILDERVAKAYPNKIMNVHPALIPSFCGPGYYGLHVHEAVLASGVKLTGATVHFANEVCDGGPIILQGAVPVRNDDTPESLQQRVMEECEWKLLPRAASLFCEGKITVENGIARVSE